MTFAVIGKRDLAEISPIYPLVWAALKTITSISPLPELPTALRRVDPPRRQCDAE
jgi:hypothetical protein